MNFIVTTIICVGVIIALIIEIKNLNSESKRAFQYFEGKTLQTFDILNKQIKKCRKDYNESVIPTINHLHGTITQLQEQVSRLSEEEEVNKETVKDDK